MPKKDLPEDQLQAVWRALDHDSSGFITTNEFGPFMRMAQRAGKVCAEYSTTHRGSCSGTLSASPGQCSILCATPLKLLSHAANTVL